MSLRVQLISAGAGSGKTTRIVRELMLRLAPDDGSEGIPPSGVLATTFTRKAAAELLERVREALLERGREDLAERLGEAMIGTVDSVAGELVRRFAFDVGLSPQMENLDEEAEFAAFAEALSGQLTSERLERMHHAERAFGLPTSEEQPGAGRKPVKGRSWRQVVNRVAAAARSNLLAPAELKACAERSIQGLERLLGPVAKASPDRELASAIGNAAAAIRAGADKTKVTAEYLELLDESDEALGQDRLDWKHWAKLAKCQPGAKSREAAVPVQEAASLHFSHPALRVDLAEFIRGVFDLAADSLEAYDVWKRERKLLDFTDMEAKALALLARPAVRETLSERLRLVLVDEFQDTSPLQLALFLKLAELAPESIWVGDPKQAIYGFRGTDPSLMQSALAALPPPGPDAIQRTSYRSRKPLVELVSELFVPAFAGVLAREQVELQAHRGEEPELGPPIFHWPIAAVRGRGPNAIPIAAGIARLLGAGGGQPVQVRDRAGGSPRPAQASDIAVLCRSNSRCQHIARELEALGIRAALEREGLLATPESTLVLACLRRLVDRRDTLATAEIVSLSAPDPRQESWLAERLAYLTTGQPPELWRASDPAVRALDRLELALAHLSPSEVLDRVLDVTGAWERVAAWGRRAVRHGNLEALRRLALAYEEECGRTHSGASLAGLVHWLQKSAGTPRDRQASGSGPDAVQVQTVHGSKGLEYPVVVFAQTDWTHPVEAFGVETVGRDGPLDLSDPLAGRWIRYWPWPYGNLEKVEGLDARIEEMPEHGRWEAAARGEAIRLLYVGLTRARDALVLPTTLKKDQTRPHHPWLDLVLGEQDAAGDRQIWLSAEPGARTFDLTLTQGSITVVTQPPMEASPEGAPAALAPDWFRPPMQGEPLPAAHRAVSDLTLPPGETVATGAPIEVGLPLAHAGGLPWAELGTALHAVLAADELEAPADERRARAAALLASHCPAAPRAVLPEALLERSRQLSDALTRAHGPGRWLREWPVRLALDGVTASGWIDLAVETTAGWVLVDHKSFPGLDREEWAARAVAYAAQLAAYALALEGATGKPVLAAYVHLVVGGALVPVILPSGESLRRLVAGALAT